MTNRLRSFKACIDELGGSAEWWRKLRMSDKDFPKPIRGLWDFKALNLYLDKINNLEPKSVDYESIVAERIAKRGSIQSAVHSN